MPGVEGLLGIGRETLTEHVAIPALPGACRLRALGTGVPEGERKVVVRPGLVAGEAQMPAKAPQFAEDNGKDPDAGKDWGQEEKGTTEGEMAGWHEFE